MVFGLRTSKILDTQTHNITDSQPSNESMYQVADDLQKKINSVILGKNDIVKLCLTALFAGEHLLLEDVPGVGKTMMGKTIAKTINSRFSRIQFTPDLLPSDITGSSTYNVKTNEFVFNQGSIFSNFVLADEINRAPPRTQSALLEVMSDNQVSVDGQTYPMDSPFMVIATQNPYEFEGTYTLPESQLDRFLMRLSMGYPDREFESDILLNHRSGDPVDGIQPVCGGRMIRQIQTAVKSIAVEESIAGYIMDVVNQTRQSQRFSVGVSTRGALAWYRAVQALAFLDRRPYAIPDDAKDLATKVLSHRVQLAGSGANARREEAEAAIIGVVNKVPLPS